MFPVLSRLFEEGRRRKLNPFWTKITGALLFLFAAVEIYGAPFGFVDSFILRGVFVAFALSLTFLCYTPFFPPLRAERRKRFLFPTSFWRAQVFSSAYGSP